MTDLVTLQDLAMSLTTRVCPLCKERFVTYTFAKQVACNPCQELSDRRCSLTNGHPYCPKEHGTRLLRSFDQP